jgi:3-deoxy-D-manno-octulosonic-acid transferase
LLRERDVQCWLPYDTPGSVRRFLARHRPLAGVLMETEAWPNLLHGAARAGVPMVLANARLSERSRRKGERFDALMRPAAAALAFALAQTEDDARRLRTAGVHEVLVMGNLKFDMTPPPALLQRGRGWRAALGARPVVLFAASREGEEAVWLEAWLRHASQGQVQPQGQPKSPAESVSPLRPLLLLVPRHPQRFDEVEALLRARGLVVVRRSTWGDGLPPAEAANADALLGDTMGEMPAYSALADLALLGGSFAPLGGQNLIEAAACACPLLMGPHTFNFAQAAELALAAGAAERCADLDTAAGRAVALLHDDGAGALPDMARRATAFAAAHRGAAARMAEALLARIAVR